MGKFIFYKIGQFIIKFFPLAVAYRISMFLSDLQYVFSFRDRRAVRANLRVIVGTDKNIEPMVRDIFRNFGKYLVDFFRMDKTLTMEFIRQSVTVENIEYLQQALTHKKGGIVITAHLGNWELGGVLVSMLGYPLTAIALPHKERPVNDLFNNQRGSKGMSVIPSNIAVRKCIETLRNNGMIAIAADRDFTANGEIMDFLGKKALIPKGAAVFSFKTGAPIVPCFCIRNPDDSFTLSFGEAMFPPYESGETIAPKILMEMMRKYVTVIEAKIRQYPNQWLMFRQFWVDEKEEKN